MSERVPAIRVLLLPKDTNAYGTIFGGVLLSFIDQAGAVGAHEEIMRRGHAAKPLVTVAMDRVEFHEPVHVGDTVSFWTECRRIGTTSITMHVSVETDRAGARLLLTQAEVTYVAVEMRRGQRQPVSIAE